MPKTFRSIEELQKREAYLHIHKIPHQNFNIIVHEDGKITIEPLGGNHLSDFRKPYKQSWLLPKSMRRKTEKM